MLFVKYNDWSNRKNGSVCVYRTIYCCRTLFEFLSDEITVLLLKSSTYQDLELGSQDGNGVPMYVEEENGEEECLFFSVTVYRHTTLFLSVEKG